jgi:hypothetical protein
LFRRRDVELLCGNGPRRGKYIPIAYTRRVVFELVFMLVLLKIPLVYLCLVVWWAIRAEPRDDRPSEAVRVSDTPPPHADWSRAAPRGGGTGGRRGTRTRVPNRQAGARRTIAR